MLLWKFVDICVETIGKDIITYPIVYNRLKYVGMKKNQTFQTVTNCSSLRWRGIRI